MASRSRWALLYWWPFRRADQALFAEALSQTLAAGLEVSAAVRIAAAATPGPRLRAALREMATDCRGGYTLADSLDRTGAAVSRELLAALAVGEDRGDLSEALAAFAGRDGGCPAKRLATAQGRRPNATRFAAALARLLRDRRLTVRLVEDAARLAAGDGSAFARAVGRVAEDMRNGSDFSQALSRERFYFDDLYCALVGAPDNRDQLRAVLARIGRVSDAEPCSATDGE